MLFPFLLFLVAAAQEAPTGEYYGSTLVLKMFKVEVWVEVIDNEHVNIRSSLGLDCENEPFFINDDNEVSLGDCFVEAMEEGGQTLKSLTYDFTNDEIHLEVVKDLIVIQVPVSITLKKKET